ncbi:MAG: 2-C-methyl-D-erythritol 2,4-cyclodiphosphate synthase [Prevotella sp.]|nr:2-C-methyl-D-erythritol 2,4-cyclodiphosphate synthase [Prevotella sp.]
MVKRKYETSDSLDYKLLLDNARRQRENPTEAEALMWKYLSGDKLGEHFRRQHPIDNYIADFVCLRKQLVIEIDGGYHEDIDQQKRDDFRTRELAKKGFQVVRFTNEEVLADTDRVVSDISQILNNKESGSIPPSLVEGQGVGSSNPPSLGEGQGVGLRVGMGFDVHRLVEGRDLILGGIRIEHSLGLLGHSDADVLIHAIADALLGAANLRDIGYHFPDTSDDTLNMDSKVILSRVIDLLDEHGWEVVNVDATVCAERPKLNPHIPAMQQCLSEVMNTHVGNISIKATTTERLGFTGRQEGISAYAVCLIQACR